nr:Histone-lysine N-methyltransferase setd3 [Polyrhizophydium stewartii]
MSASDDFESLMASSLATDLSSEIGNIMDSSRTPSHTDPARLASLEHSVSALRAQVAELLHRTTTTTTTTTAAAAAPTAATANGVRPQSAALARGDAQRAAMEGEALDTADRRTAQTVHNVSQKLSRVFEDLDTLKREMRPATVSSFESDRLTRAIAAASREIETRIMAAMDARIETAVASAVTAAMAAVMAPKRVRWEASPGSSTSSRPASRRLSRDSDDSDGGSDVDSRDARNGAGAGAEAAAAAASNEWRRGRAGGASGAAPTERDIAAQAREVDGDVEALLGKLKVKLGQKARLVRELNVQQAARDARYGGGDTAAAAREAAMRGFHEWLDANGVDTACVELAPASPDGLDWGLIARCDIKRHDLVLQIPRRLMLIGSPDTPELARFVKSNMLLASNPSTLLAFRILVEELNPKSFWKPYIDALPRSFNLPMFSSPQVLETFKGTSVYETIMADQLMHVKQFLYILHTLRNNVPEFSDEGHKTRDALGLIPLFDMCNHVRGEMTTSYNPESSASETFAPLDMRKGDAMCITYGNRPNQDLAMYSGFLDPAFVDNDYLVVIPPLTAQDLGDKLFVSAVQALKIALPKTIKLRGPPIEETTPLLLTLLRVRGATPDLRQKIAVSADRHAIVPDPSFLPRKAEETVWKTVLMLCTLAQRRAGRAINEDRAMLVAGTADLACRLRVAEHDFAASLVAHVKDRISNLAQGQ